MYSASTLSVRKRGDSYKDNVYVLRKYIFITLHIFRFIPLSVPFFVLFSVSHSNASNSNLVCHLIFKKWHLYLCASHKAFHILNDSKNSKWWEQVKNCWRVKRDIYLFKRLALHSLSRLLRCCLCVLLIFETRPLYKKKYQVKIIWHTYYYYLYYSLKLQKSIAWTTSLHHVSLPSERVGI